LAFLDIRPVVPDHVLVVPKNHCRNIFDATPEDITSLFLVVKKISTALKQALNCDGVNIQNNNESAAGQVIMHLHIHLIPRYQDDNLHLWPGTDYEPGQISLIAEKIRKEI